jgi:hypothetical protein
MGWTVSLWPFSSETIFVTAISYYKTNPLKMKKLFCPIAIISLFAAFLTLSCRREDVQPPLQNRIIGKWTMDAAIADHTDYGVIQNDTTRFTTNDYFDFKADGTVSIMASSVSYDGNWIITGNTLVFTNTGYVDFPGGFSVLTLSSSELKLNHAQNNPPDHYLDAKMNFKR